METNTFQHSKCRNISEYIDSYFSDRSIGTVRTAQFQNAEEFLKVYRKGEFQIVLYARLGREDLSEIVTFEQNLNDEMEPTVKSIKGRAF